jgi:HEAT repeat protein
LFGVVLNRFLIVLLCDSPGEKIPRTGFALLGKKLSSPIGWVIFIGIVLLFLNSTGISLAAKRRYYRSLHDDEIKNFMNCRSSNEKSWLLRELEKHPDKKVTPILLDTFEEGARYSTIRVRYYFALAASRDPRVVKPLLKEVSDWTEMRSKSDPVSALRKYMCMDFIPPLVEVISDSSCAYYVKEEAARLIASLNEKKVDEIILDFLSRDDNVERKAWAARIVGMCGMEGGDGKLIEILKNNSDTLVRKYSAIALGCYGNTKSIDALLEVINSKEKVPVTAGAVQALGSIGDAISPQFLMALLRHNLPPKVRIAVIEALGKAGSREVVPLLINTVKCDKRQDIRNKAYLDLLKMFPFKMFPEFPTLKSRLSRSGRDKQTKLMNLWFQSRKQRLAWSYKSNRFYYRN